MVDGTDSTHTGGEAREQVRVSGRRLVATIKRLIHEGNVRHIVIKNDEGRTLFEFPISVGVAGALLLPVWATVGSIAARVTQCTIEVVRTADPVE